jgi:hypothetical protein
MTGTILACFVLTIIRWVYFLIQLPPGSTLTESSQHYCTILSIGADFFERF